MQTTPALKISPNTNRCRPAHVRCGPKLNGRLLSHYKMKDTWIDVSAPSFLSHSIWLASQQGFLWRPFPSPDGWKTYEWSPVCAMLCQGLFSVLASKTAAKLLKNVQLRESNLTTKCLSTCNELTRPIFLKWLSVLNTQLLTLLTGCRVNDHKT